MGWDGRGLGIIPVKYEKLLCTSWISYPSCPLACQPIMKNRVVNAYNA